MKLQDTIRNGLAAAAAAAILAGGPAAAQEDARLQSLQEQISKLQKELAALRGDVAKSKQEIRKANERAAVAKAAPQPNQPIVKMSSSNRPEICSADGRNCIALTSRLHIDVGGYDYRPNSALTSPQNLFGGPILRRA